MSDFCQIPRKNCNVVLKFVCKNPIQTIKTKKKKKKLGKPLKNHLTNIVIHEFLATKNYVSLYFHTS